MIILSNYMFPSLKINYFSNSFSANTVLFCKNFMVYPFSCLFSNISNNIFCQLCVACFFSFCRLIQFVFKGMMAILLRCDPFKIFNKVMKFNTINMINLREVVRIWNKGSSNKPMNKKFSFTPIFTENNILITLFSCLIFHNFTAYRFFSVPATFTKSIERFYFTKVGYFVLIFKIVNGLPLFKNHFITSFMGLNNDIYNKLSQG